MSGLASALYVGQVVHARHRPARHRLRYRMMSVLLDLDELAQLDASLCLFSAGRFNLFSFSARDHLAGTDEPLRDQVEKCLRDAGITPDSGPIRLLTMPRVLGGVFNPLSLFYCYGRDGRLRAVVHEVNNTFGQRHCYALPVEDPAAPIHRQRCAKEFYVSPFLDMALGYRFRLTEPGDAVSVAIEVRDEAGTILSAALAARRQPLTDGALLRQWLRHPALSLQVLGSIHWEALKLWRKGLRLYPRPDKAGLGQARTPS